MNNERVKMTLLLDSKTIQILKDYSYRTTGSTNVSRAVMSIAQKYDTEYRSKTS